MSTSQPRNEQLDKISTASPTEAVQLATTLSCQGTSARDSEALFELDKRFFCQEAPAGKAERYEAVLALVQLFIAEAGDSDGPIARTVSKEVSNATDGDL